MCWTIRTPRITGAVYFIDDGANTLLSIAALNQPHPIRTAKVLRIGALLYFGATLLFGVGMPLLGLLILLVGISPSGGDPAEVAMGLCFSGPCTALFYLPLGCVLWLAARNVARQHPHALTWTLVAVIASTFPCMLVGIALGFFVWKSMNPITSGPTNDI